MCKKLRKYGLFLGLAGREKPCYTDAVMSLGLAVLLLTSVSASAEYGRSYRAPPTKTTSQTQRVYSMVPAIHYVHEDQWLQYKAKQDAEALRLSELARAQNALFMQPIYSSQYKDPAAFAPPAPPAPSGPPGRAEVTEFKETFEDTVAAFVTAKKRKNKGVFHIKDDHTGETLRLRLQHVNGDRLIYHSVRQVSGFAEFVTVNAPKREVELEFELSKDWEWEVSRIFVHGINGRERYTYNANNARVPVVQAAAVADVPRPKAPAHLSAAVQFAEDAGSLSVTVSNAGPGDAYAVRLRLDVNSAPNGVTLPEDTLFGDLRPGQSETKILPVSIPTGSKGGRVKALASVVEANGFDTEPMMIEFAASPAALPALSLSAAAVAGGSVKPGEAAHLSVTVRNTGRARAVGARATLRLGGADLFMSGEPSVALGDLAPGESKDVAFEFFVNRRVAAGADLPVFLSVADSLGRYGFSDTVLPLKMGQQTGSLRVVSIKNQEAGEETPSVDVAPATRTPQDPRAYAVVVGIEKYRDVAGVDYASRDAQAVIDHLTGSMGFKPENVVLLKNERAGRADLSTYLGPWLSDRVTGNGKSRVFVYYSGHGTVNPKTGESYLVPYDGDPSYPETKGFPLKDLYASLGRLPNAEAVVALDSCFSGSGGRSILPRGVRPLMMVKDAHVPSNVVVLSASGADQVSAAHPKAQHGLMTYYLLSGLGGPADFDRDGKITTLELYRYLSPAVEADARRQHIEQRPRLAPSPEAIGSLGSSVWVVR
jgi:hypothetical protein